MLKWLCRIGPVAVLLGLLIQAYAELSGNNTIPHGSFWVGVGLIGLGGILSWISQEQQNNKILELNNSIINNLTEGNSFCVFRPMQIYAGKGNPFYWVVTNDGKYPIYDVEFLVNYYENDKIVESKEGWKNIGTIPVGGIRTLPGQINVINSNIYQWDIHIRTRFKYYHEIALMDYKSDSEYNTAIALVVIIDQKIVYRSREDNFSPEKLPPIYKKYWSESVSQLEANALPGCLRFWR